MMMLLSAGALAAKRPICVREHVACVHVKNDKRCWKTSRCTAAMIGHAMTTRHNMAVRNAASTNKPKAQNIRRRTPQRASVTSATLAPAEWRTPPLARVAIVTDTHFWPKSAARLRFSSLSDAQSSRDGLLVNATERLQPRLWASLRKFSASGDFGVHLGDLVCGGRDFGTSPSNHRASLRAYHHARVAALGEWPMHHIPGNHDLDPEAIDGIATWAAELGTHTTGHGWRSVRLAPGWRLLLLNSQAG